ncbi:hypothetical protein MUK42_19813, partial [Musa troglodytarum]
MEGASCRPVRWRRCRESWVDPMEEEWRLKRDAFITSSCSTENEPCCCHRSRESQIEPGSSLNSSNRTKRGLLLCPSVRRSSSNTTNPQAPSAHLLPTLDLEFDLRRANARFGN